jgi:hypothetical protein
MLFIHLDRASGTIDHGTADEQEVGCPRCQGGLQQVERAGYVLLDLTPFLLGARLMMEAPGQVIDGFHVLHCLGDQSPVGDAALNELTPGICRMLTAGRPEVQHADRVACLP